MGVVHGKHRFTVRVSDELRVSETSTMDVDNDEEGSKRDPCGHKADHHSGTHFVCSQERAHHSVSITQDRREGAHFVLAMAMAIVIVIDCVISRDF